MKVFLRYITRCMTEKKSRLFLLVFSIMLSTMLLVGSLGVMDMISNSYKNAYMTGYEGKQISITADDTPIFKLSDIKTNGVKEVDGELVGTFVLKHDNEDDEIIYTTLRGKQLGQIERNYKESVLEGSIADLPSDGCIISKRISVDRAISIGDKVVVSLMDKELELNVKAICSDTGLFYVDQSNQFSLIVSHDCLSDFFDVDDDDYNVVFAIPDGEASESITIFNDANKDEGFTAKAMYAADLINDQYESFLVSMYAMMVIVIMTCFVIILGAFSLVINERLSTIGTFLSVGATSAKIKGLLFAESCLYGVLGGIIGDILGVVGLSIINRKISPFAQYGVIEEFNMNYFYLVYGFLFAIILSLVSAGIPVMKISKMPIKDVILNNFYVPVKFGWGSFIVGTVMLGVSVVGMISKEKWTIDYAPIFAVTCVLGLLFVATKLIERLSKLTGFIFKNISNTVYLSLNNLRTSRVLLSNALLIIVTLIASISIGAVSNSLVKSISDAFIELKYDAVVTNISNTSSDEDDDAVLDRLREMEIIDKSSLNSFYDVSGVLEEDLSVKVLGINPDSFANYMEYLRLRSSENLSVYTSFSNSTDNSVIVSDKLLRAMNKKVNEQIRINVNDKEEYFTIIGSIDGRVFCSGAFVLLKYDNMKTAFDLKEPSKVTVSFMTNDSASLKELKKEMVDFQATCLTYEEQKEKSVKSMSTLCDSLTVFSKIVIVISVFGIINNMLVGLFQRKKELALLQSVGMSKSNKNMMLFGEAVATFLFSVMIILPYCYLMINLCNKFMNWAGLAVDITLNRNELLFPIAIAFVSVLLASIPVLVKSNKISVMNELRYE